MFWLLKQLQPPVGHEHPELQNFHIPSLCHLRRRSSLWSPYLRPYREDILIRYCSVLCELLVGNPFRHLADVGYRRNVERPLDQFLQAPNIKSKQV